MSGRMSVDLIAGEGAVAAIVEVGVVVKVDEEEEERKKRKKEKSRKKNEKVSGID